MKEIFISYSTVDSSKAESVRNILEENGFSCWMAPRDIPTGSNYTKEIPVAIRNCSIFVLMLSENAQRSLTLRSIRARSFCPLCSKNAV